MKQKVQLIYGDDWEGLYIDGTLVMQDHKLSIRDVLIALKIPHTETVASLEWLDSEGMLPEYFSDVIEAE